MDLHSSLKASVHLFINNASWNIPQIFYHRFLHMQDVIEKITIPTLERDDQFIWNHSHDGGLTFKEAYQFHCKAGQNISWAKSIWNIAIPPSKSFMVWRTLHNKLPTDENLSLRGFQLPSMCSLCYLHQENTAHMFLDCKFAKEIWNWLASVVKVQCDFSIYNSRSNSSLSEKLVPSLQDCDSGCNDQHFEYHLVLQEPT